MDANLKGNFTKSPEGKILFFHLATVHIHCTYMYIPPLDLNNVSSTPPSSTESEKSNVPLPQNKSKSVQNVVQNMQNNPPDPTDTNIDGKIGNFTYGQKGLFSLHVADTGSPPQSVQTTKVLPPPLSIPATAASASPVLEPPGDIPTPGMYICMYIVSGAYEGRRP